MKKDYYAPQHVVSHVLQTSQILRIPQPHHHQKFFFGHCIPHRDLNIGIIYLLMFQSNMNTSLDKVININCFVATCSFPVFSCNFQSLAVGLESQSNEKDHNYHNVFIFHLRKLWRAETLFLFPYQYFD